jgi:hypothetical protein
MGGVSGMDGSTRAGPGTDAVRGARVVSVGQKNPGDTVSGDFLDGLLGRLHWIDAEISCWMANQIAVKVVAMGLGKPRPGKDVF